MDIRKYPIDTKGTRGEADLKIKIGKGSKVVHVAEQNGLPTLWVLCDPGAPEEWREYVVVGTGQQFAPDRVYVGTAFVGPFVWHVLEIVR